MTDTPPRPRASSHVAPGLSAPVTIATDRWGIAHIRAGSEPDLFFAQGFNAARDRLWQMDLWRKRGLGLLAADFGPGYLEQDRAARLFLYRGDLAQDWSHYGPGAEAIAEAFVAGLNAHVDAVLAGTQPMPPEFTAMDTQPARWQASDIVRIRSHALTRNVLSEVLRGITLATHGPKADLLREELRPRVTPYHDPDLPPGAIPMAALEDFKLATAEVSFSRERLAATLDEASRWRRLAPTGEIVVKAEGEGSNNWVVAPSRTASGRPILASDPHRAHGMPGIRYLVHLKAPGLNVIGAGEPQIPGIAFGHNGHAAFAFTIFQGDQEDMMVYETDGPRYRYGDGWEDMQVIEETFAVKGAPDQVRQLKFTRHGPVVYEDAGRACAIRTCWSLPGGAAYLASLATMRAGSFDAFRSALEGWGTPTLNHVYADVTGTIGWQTAGTVPVRPNWNGLLPVPGDGRYEWQGRLDIDSMPHDSNPECGYLYSANENKVPPDWTVPAERIGMEWADSSRAERIDEVLGRDAPLDLDAMAGLQTDLLSRIARRMQAVLAAATLGAEAREPAALLSDWDCVMAPGSAPALFLEVWSLRHLRPALFTALTGKAEGFAALAPGSAQTTLDILEAPADWLDGPDPEAQRDAILSASLAAAWAAAKAEFGVDPSGWAWGALHQLPLPHKLAPVTDDAVSWSIPAMNVGGNGSTVANAVYRPSDFRVVIGPSVRLLIDVGAWDNSRFVNLPGQSGVPGSPHYADLAEAWLNGTYFPLLYSDAAVDDATEAVLTLTPG